MIKSAWPSAELEPEIQTNTSAVNKPI